MAQTGNFRFTFLKKRTGIGRIVLIMPDAGRERPVVPAGMAFNLMKINEE